MKIKKFLRENGEFQVVRVGQQVSRAVQKQLGFADLNFYEGLLLTALYFETGRSARPSELQKAFGFTAGNVSHCLRTLESKKWIRRSSVEDDARGYSMTMTSKGEAEAQKLIGVFDRLQSRFEKRTTEAERRIFQKVLATLEGIELPAK